MPSDGAGNPQSPTSDDGFTLVGKSGKPAKAGQGSGKKPPAPAAADPAGGLDGAPAADSLGTPSGTASGKKPSAKPRSASPGRDHDADRHAELLAAISGLAEQVKDVSLRVTDLEHGSSRGHRASEGDSDCYSSDASSRSGSDSSEQLSSTDDEGDGKSYIRVYRNLGHWNCKELEANNDQEPHLYSLHGYEPFDGLQSTRHGGGGTLGLGLRWMEPTCTYFKTGVAGLKGAIRMLDELRDDHRAGGEPPTRAELSSLRSELMGCYNTLSGAFNLGNTYRTLLVERAKVCAPGAKRADKERAEWVERAIDDERYAAPDIAADVRRLKADYDYEAHKADLRRAAGKGGASSGERSNRRDDESRGGGKTKTQKRRERRERTRDERGSRRDDSRERAPSARGGNGSGSRGGGGGGSRGGDGGRSSKTRRDTSRDASRENRPARGGGRDGGKGNSRRGRSPSDDSRRGGGKGGGGGRRDDGKNRRGGGGGRRDGRRDGGRGDGGRSSGSDSDHSWS